MAQDLVLPGSFVSRVIPRPRTEALPSWISPGDVTRFNAGFPESEEGRRRMQVLVRNSQRSTYLHHAAEVTQPNRVFSEEPAIRQAPFSFPSEGLRSDRVRFTSPYPNTPPVTWAAPYRRERQPAPYGSVGTENKDEMPIQQKVSPPYSTGTGPTVSDGTPGPGSDNVYTGGDTVLTDCH
eukprot:548998-Hanusia_phi.AAC.3